MFRTDSIYSLTDFQRNARSHLQRLKESGQPEILTINGQAEVVVQNAAAYQELVDKLDAIEAVRKSLESMKRDEGRSVDSFFADLERKHAITR
jgi:PHD/YefM family antitoxin component YafN of YafNO toxin-antitoxin module